LVNLEFIIWFDLVWLGLMTYVSVCDRLFLLQYFAMNGNSGKQNEGRENESRERNHYEEAMLDYIPRDEEEASIAMLIGNLNDHYPIPNDLMDLTTDLQHHQATSSSMPPEDHAYVGSSDDQVSFNDFEWW